MLIHNLTQFENPRSVNDNKKNKYNKTLTTRLDIGFPLLTLWNQDMYFVGKRIRNPI